MAQAQNPVNWFEIPASDLDRAKGFYEAVFGIELALNEMGPMKMAWFPAAMGVPGAAGTLVEFEEGNYTPSKEGSLVYFSVAAIDPVLAKVAANGGSTLGPRTSIGEYGFIAHFEDSEGNRVGIHEAPAGQD